MHLSNLGRVRVPHPDSRRTYRPERPCHPGVGKTLRGHRAGPHPWPAPFVFGCRHPTSQPPGRSLQGWKPDQQAGTDGQRGVAGAARPDRKPHQRGWFGVWEFVVTGHWRRCFLHAGAGGRRPSGHHGFGHRLTTGTGFAWRSRAVKAGHHPNGAGVRKAMADRTDYGCSGTLFYGNGEGVYLEHDPSVPA